MPSAFVRVPGGDAGVVFPYTSHFDSRIARGELKLCDKDGVDLGSTPEAEKKEKPADAVILVTRQMLVDTVVDAIGKLSADDFTKPTRNVPESRPNLNSLRNALGYDVSGDVRDEAFARFKDKSGGVMPVPGMNSVANG